MATSPVSQHPPPFYPRHSSRSLPSSIQHSRSSSVESRPRGRPLYAHNRSPSQDSLYVSMDSSCGPIQRWDGLAREATEWNSLRRDPELYLPIGNCLVFLYAAGSSQRGPSFRIPYDLLLYSGCRPLIDRCLMSASTSEYHPASSTPPSYDTVDYPMSSEDNCSFLYLPSPTGLSRDESYVYHLTSRNFFAWLLGVPLVGTDPVSALLDLKIRMDKWRDPGSGNFGALFDYVKEQGYGDFEALEIEMGKRLNPDMHHGNSAIGFPPTNPIIFNEQSRPKEEEKTLRRNSLTQRIRRKLSRSRTREDERPTSAIPGTNNVEIRLQTLRINSYTHGPSPPSADHISAAMQRLVGPPSTQSVDTVLIVQNGKEQKMKKRLSWTNIAGNAWKCKSMTDVRLPPLRSQQPHLVGSSANEGPYMSAPVSAQVGSTEPMWTPAEKKKRLSWKRLSMADIKLPPLQPQQPQSDISSAMNQSPSAPALADLHSPQPTPTSVPVSGEEKKTRRLSWANVSDKIFDIMMPPMSKDDLPSPPPQSQEGASSTTGMPVELSAAGVAAASSSPAAVALPSTEAKPASSPSAGGSATRSSSRHPSIHDFSTGKEICACCGKVRQPRPQSSAGPSQSTPTEVEVIKDVKDKGAFEKLHGHMKARRNKFKSRPHKEIIVPDYGNGTRGLTTNAGKGTTISTKAEVSLLKMKLGSKGRNNDARKMKPTSVDAMASPVDIRTADARMAKTRSVENPLSIDAIVAPVETRTQKLKKRNSKHIDAVPSSVKLQPGTSVAVSAGRMLATELMASPTMITKLSGSSSGPVSSSLRDYRRSSRPASLDYGRRPVGSAGPGVVNEDSGGGGVNDTNDIHYRHTTAREPATGSTNGSGSARPATERQSQERELEQGNFRVVDADFESNIEDLLAQLEAAGISETKTQTGKDNRKSMAGLEPRTGLPSLVYEVA
jgi:hypothetical protein